MILVRSEINHIYAEIAANFHGWIVDTNKKMHPLWQISWHSGRLNSTLLTKLCTLDYEFLGLKDICLCSQKVISNKSWTLYRTWPSLTWLSPNTKLLSTQVKARLGGRLRLIISGGAALSTEVEEFLRVTCCAFFVQGYGKETPYLHKHYRFSFTDSFSAHFKLKDSPFFVVICLMSFLYVVFAILFKILSKHSEQPWYGNI